jgi:hypothetical protein
LATSPSTAWCAGSRRTSARSRSTSSCTRWPMDPR